MSRFALFCGSAMSSRTVESTHRCPFLSYRFPIQSTSLPLPWQLPLLMLVMSAQELWIWTWIAAMCLMHPRTIYTTIDLPMRPKAHNVIPAEQPPTTLIKAIRLSSAPWQNEDGTPAALVLLLLLVPQTVAAILPPHSAHGYHLPHPSSPPLLLHVNRLLRLLPTI